MTPQWIQRLLMLDAPDGAALRGVGFALRGGLSPWVAALALAGGAALAVTFYRREGAKLGTPARALLAGLRTLLIGLVVLMLMRPVLVAEFAGERPRGVVVLVDASQSMTIADRRVTDKDWERVEAVRGSKPATADPVPRDQMVRDALGSGRLRLLERLAEKGPVSVVLFDRKLTPAGDGWLAAYRPDGTQTALADAVHEVLTRQAGEPPAAVVVISDGRDTASVRTFDEVAKACREQGVGLHVWGVGSSEAGVLAFKEVRVPSTIFLDDKPDQKDDPVEVPVRFRCRGFKSGTVAITLTVGDQSVTQTVPVTEGEDLTRTLRLTPRKGKDGERPVTVTLKLVERPDVGDRADRVVRVRNARIKVLYVENAPRREYKFIQPALDRDRRLLVRLHLADGDPALASQGADKESGAMFLERFPEAFPEPDAKDPDRRPFDLVILGDVPAKVLGERGLKALPRWVKEGGGLVMIAGRRHAPAEYAGTALAEALPVEFRREEFADADLKAAPFRPVLTSDGEKSALMTLDDRPDVSRDLWAKGMWRDAPGFYWHYPVLGLRPGATALLVHPDRKVGRRPDERPLPLVAAKPYGKGDVLFVGVEETWRWRDGTGDRYTARFWGQTAAQLGLPHLLGNARRSQLELERGEPVLGVPGAVKGRFLSAGYEPVVRPAVRAVLVNLERGDQRDVTLQRVPGLGGEYRAALPNDAPGRHELRVPAGDGLEAATLPLRVELPPRHELLELGMAEEALRGLASAAGGAFYREEELNTLPDRVEAKGQPFTQRAEVLLWGWLPFALFVGLITAEWVVRKFSNLS
ncbi:MAG: hypothetical protein ACRC33_06785 [Gemmataceae bacterium]